jgi:pimeloyl-ACP methyl ester carboxylesterase
MMTEMSENLPATAASEQALVHGTPHEQAASAGRTGGKASASVFLHGSGDSARTWDAVIAALPDFECIALDLPGHGALRERPGPEAMSVSDYADFIHNELTRRGLSGVCLIGHSLGGGIALRLAVDHPADVGRIVSVGSGARLRVLPAVLQGAKDTPAETWPATVLSGFASGHEEQAHAYFAAMLPFAPGAFFRDLNACDHFDMVGELARVSQAALAIVGDQDTATPPKYSIYLRDHLRDCQLMIVANAGHYVHAEHPTTVAEAIRAWLTSPESAS